MTHQGKFSTGEPISETNSTFNALPKLSLRSERMSEANHMINMARASSPRPDTISTIDSYSVKQPISPISVYSRTHPRPETMSPGSTTSRIPPRPNTTSPESATSRIRARPDTMTSVRTASRIQPRPETMSPTTTYPKIQPWPETPPSAERYPKIKYQPESKSAAHISSSMRPASEAKPRKPTSSIPKPRKPTSSIPKPRKPTSSIQKPRLERLSKADLISKIEAREREETMLPADMTTEILSEPERILMGTPCFKIDQPSDDSSMEGESNARGSFAAKSRTEKASSKIAQAAKRETRETLLEKIPKTSIDSEARIQVYESFKSNPNLRIDTPLEKFSASNTDTEKGIFEDPPAYRSGLPGPPGGPPGPPGGFLSAQMSKPHEIAFIFMVCTLQLIPQATLTTCFPISSTIAEWFHIEKPTVLPWMVAAYATTFGTFILISGRLGDIFGHKKLVIIGFIMMTLWSVVAGMSHLVSPILFFVARAMQGLAASMLVPNGLALFGRTYAPGSKMKMIGFSLFGLCAPLGAYCGMLFGALISQYLSWWFCFFVLAIVSFLLAIASRIVFVTPPPTPAQMKPFREKLGDMDWLGAFTGITGLICVQVAFVSAPSAGWNTSWIFMLLIIGALLIGGFIVVEIKVAEHPLVPFRMLGSDVAFVLAAVACGWGVFGIWSWYIWRYFLGIRHYTPLVSAVHVLPMVPVALMGSALTAYLMRTTKPAYILLYATCAATLGPLFLYFTTPTQSYWSFTLVSILVMPIFMDLCLPSAAYIMSNFFPMHLQGVSGSLVATVMNYSISLGLGLATTAEAYTSIGDTREEVEMAGIHGGWLVGVCIGGLGVVTCIVYLYKSVLSPKATARLPTIRDLEVASMMQIDPNDDLSDHEASNEERLRTAHSAVSKPTSALKLGHSLRKKGSIAKSMGLARWNSNNTGRPSRFSMVGSFVRGRRNSDASDNSSLFPLTRHSSQSTVGRSRRPRNRDTLTTALPDWRDRMMPQFEWRQVEMPRTSEGSGGTRYAHARQIRISQRTRYYQGRKT